VIGFPRDTDLNRVRMVEDRVRRELETNEATPSFSGNDLKSRALSRFASLLRCVGEDAFQAFGWGTDREYGKFRLRPEAYWSAQTLLVLADALESARSLAAVPKVVGLDARLHGLQALPFHAAALIAAEGLVHIGEVGSLSSYLEDVGDSSQWEAEYASRLDRDQIYGSAGIAVATWYRKSLEAWAGRFRDAETGIRKQALNPDAPTSEV
jgi:hypothetical protein